VKLTPSTLPIDTSYRQAVKLERMNFSTNFQPANHGVLDEIRQVLLPAYCGPDVVDGTEMRIHAELYKLNVYSAPSGKFRSQVDTPRSSFRFGSLVVSFTSSHEGGDLVVRHNDTSFNYIWGASRDIEWAAFYADCEHEVLEVTKGHRVTLTYTLSYITSKEPFLLLMRPNHKLNKVLVNAMSTRQFMPNGGFSGFLLQPFIRSPGRRERA
jgi:hypothetical protein